MRNGSVVFIGMFVLLAAEIGCEEKPSAPAPGSGTGTAQVQPPAAGTLKAGALKIGSRLADPEKGLRAQKLDAGVVVKIGYAGPKTNVELSVEAWKDGKQVYAAPWIGHPLRLPADAEFLIGVAARKDTAGKQVLYLVAEPGDGSTDGLQARGKYLTAPVPPAGWTTKTLDAAMDFPDDAPVTVGALVPPDAKEIKGSLQELGKNSPEAWLFRVRVSSP